MPYISVTTSKELTGVERDTIRRELGFLISTIPGKSEAVLMLDIEDGHDMYFAGERRECAYVNVALYTAAPFAAKSEFAGAVCEMLEREIGIPSDDVYLTFSEYPNWCWGGSLK